MTGLFLCLVWLVPAALAAPFGRSTLDAKPYGVLLLARNVDRANRTELGSIRSSLGAVAVESVDFPEDPVSIQRAIDRLRAQHVGKIVAVPLEAVSESPFMNHLRYLFGIRAEPSDDRPRHENPGLPSPKSRNPHSLVVPSASRSKRLKSDVDLVLASTMDSSTQLVDILADRAKAQSRRPEKEAIVLVGLAPRDDKELASWKTSAAAIAEAVRIKGNFRDSGLLWVRDGVHFDQKDRDRADNRATVRQLATRGGVVVVPLALDGRIIGKMLQKQLASTAYRWNGKGLLGDVRLATWIRTTAQSASKMSDVRQYRDDAPRASGEFQ
ncbi:MAG: hypothetical protein AAB036_06165 [Elusimicrobiota bacterium]